MVRITDPKCIAEEFNKYFTTVAEELSRKLPNLPVDVSLEFQSKEKFILTNVQEKEIDGIGCI